MRLVFTVFLACFWHAFTEASFLQIENVDSPGIPVKSPVWVNPGQNLVLRCFLNCTRCQDRDSVLWHRNQKRSSNIEAATYVCRHTHRNLAKSVRIELMDRRRKRDDYYGTIPPVSFDELLKMQKDLLGRLNLDFNPVPVDDLYPLGNVDHWGNEIVADHNFYDSTSVQADDHKKPTMVNKIRIIIIIIIVVVLVVVLFLIVYCIRLHLKSKSSTTITRPRQTDTGELRSLNPVPATVRPTDMYITPYPPAIDSVEVSNAPPPSYEEAMCNAQPSAPSSNNAEPSAPCS